MTLIILAIALGVTLVATVVLMHRKPEERLPIGGSRKVPPEPHKRLPAAFASRDDLFLHIGLADFKRAVLLDGAVVHTGVEPPLLCRTMEKGGIAAMQDPMGRGAPQELSRGRSGQGGCGACGEKRPPRHPGAPQPAGATGLPPGAQELSNGFVAGRSPGAPAPAGSSAPASTRPQPHAAARPDQGGAQPQKVARA
jgi:hypothetical protein